MGVFDDVADIFATYEIELTFEEKIMGGVPKDPKVVQGWLKSKAGIDEQKELLRVTARTLHENGTNLGVEVKEIETMSPNEIYSLMDRASELVATQKATNGFKCDDDGLYVEDRQVKAMIKESVNILFAGERWGKTKKGPKGFVAERVFVRPSRIHLGRTEPDGVELVVGHVTDAKGPRSTLTYHEYVEQADISFQLEVLRDELTIKQWAQVWLHAQRNGLGALRSQSHGRFEVTKFEKVA
jgi:hypothetical protein